MSPDYPVAVLPVASSSPQDPSSPALVAQGHDLQRQGRSRDALEAFERCLAQAPDYVPAHLGACVANYHLGRWERGTAHARVALAAAPADAARWYVLAQGLRESRRLREAGVAARKALELRPSLADAWNLLGLVARDSGDVGEARSSFDRAVAIDPARADLVVNRATCDEQEGDLDAALRGYAAAERIDPRLPDAAYNRGHLLHKRAGAIRAAIGAYRDAVERDPAFAAAHLNLAHALFLDGQFAEAWRENRWRPPRLRHDAKVAAAGGRYEPRPLDPGARCRVLGEQGVGDSLFFLRFAPRLRESGIALSFSGDERLAAMLTRTGLFDEVGGPQGISNEGVLAGDLPMLLPERERGDAVPPLRLTADPARVARVRERLAGLGPPPYAALSWRAGIPGAGAHSFLFKELPLAAFGRALRGHSATWIGVQREPRPGETETLAGEIGSPVHDFSAINEDLEEALAWMSVVDEWIGVSNTNLHLRVGAAREAQVLVPFPPDWRWMASGASPWFPGARVHRQSPDGAWGDAFASLQRRQGGEDSGSIP